MTLLFFFIFLGVILAYIVLTNKPMTEYTIEKTEDANGEQKMSDGTVSRMCIITLRRVEEAVKEPTLRRVGYYSPTSDLWVGGAQDHVFSDIVVGTNIWVIDAVKDEHDLVYDGDVIVAERYTERQTHETSLVACSGVFGGMALIFCVAAIVS